jgi:shikimate dehydrogenase
MIKCAVLGSPISHSLSPLLHQTAYQELGIEGSYEAIEINESNFDSFFEKAKGEGWSGFSLTMPLKELAYLRADQSDELVKKISSANTLLNIDGKWVAISTDLLAFKSLLEVERNSKVKILGGGGTARAAVGALSGAVDEIEIYIRSDSRKPALLQAGDKSKITFKYMDELNSSGDYIISTLPKGELDPYAEKLSSGTGTFFDVIYNPWPTKTAALWNGKVISGLELLVEQAMYQITFMTGEDFNYHLMRGRLLAVAK